MEPLTDAWRIAFRHGFAPQLSIRSLAILKAALETDDVNLLQGQTTEPPPLLCVADWPVNGCCPIAYCGWKGEELESVGDVEKFFADACRNADQLLGESGAARYFLNAWDDTPRADMLPALLEEVNLAIESRQLQEVA